MKIRTDYVSNSSSSSFIVIAEGQNYDRNFLGETVILPTENGNYQFDWGFEEYSDFWSKLNFCAILLADLKRAKEYGRYEDKEDDSEWMKNWNKNQREKIEKYDEWLDLLKKVCKEKFNLNFEIELDEDKMFAYIDHQSTVQEDGKIGKMFDSYDNLYTFLASDNSFIRTGNDNTDPEEIPDGWYDGKEQEESWA